MDLQSSLCLQRSDGGMRLEALFFQNLASKPDADARRVDTPGGGEPVESRKHSERMSRRIKYSHVRQNAVAARRQTSSMDRLGGIVAVPEQLELILPPRIPLAPPFYDRIGHAHNL